VLDLQLVAFPQDGWRRAPGAEAQVIRALDAGVDVVGGIPHFERTMADGAASVRAACELAAERGLMVDLHCDESDDPISPPYRDAGRRDPALRLCRAASPDRI
jgi:cytosine deaminase